MFVPKTLLTQVVCVAAPVGSLKSKRTSAHVNDPVTVQSSGAGHGAAGTQLNLAGHRCQLLLAAGAALGWKVGCWHPGIGRVGAVRQPALCAFPARPQVTGQTGARPSLSPSPASDRKRLQTVTLGGTVFYKLD